MYIGQMLAHAPQDPVDGAWPHRVVRDLLESLKSSNAEHGIHVARMNMIGARAIDPRIQLAMSDTLRLRLVSGPHQA